MRLKANTTSRGKCYYIIRSVYKNGKNTSEIVERLGYPDEIIEKHHREDYLVWMNERLQELQEAEDADKDKKVLVPYSTTTLIPANEQQSFNVGYLFLQKIYYQLKLDLICNRISKQHAFEYDLNKILSSLVYCRILDPGSKMATQKRVVDLLERPEFDYHQVIRALNVLSEEFYKIQEELYNYSKEVIPRKTGVLYYDCTNFYFEIEEEDNISNEECDEEGIAARKYGHCKQHQPSPIVQMGLFMDYSGIPLAMEIDRGNKNEQITLVPLEKKILADFGASKFVVCTDAALSSEENRMFNNWGERSYVTAVSIKQMDAEKKKWALDPTGWKLCGGDPKVTYDIRHLEDTEEDRQKYYDLTFYKERLEEGYDEVRDISFRHSTMITFSLKYRNFLRYKRAGQIKRAQEAMESGKSKVDKKNQNDYRRFIKRTAMDKKGKTVDIKYSLNDEAIQEEQKYDGFYAVDTNLLDDVEDVIDVCRGRWEIEESFRIMKEEFRSRPVYLAQPDRIKAHFLTCYIALLIYRILERKLDEKHSCNSIVRTLRSMRMTKAKDVGYVPSYTRTDLTDKLHESAGFRTDYEIIREKAMRGVIRKSKAR